MSRRAGNQGGKRTHEEHSPHEDELIDGLKKLGWKDERDLNAAQREQQVVALRMQGYDFERIAEECGYHLADGRPNRSAAWKAWKRALARIPEQGVHEARQRMQMGYDIARRGLWPQFIVGDTKAVDAWLAVDERESKLMGYDHQPKLDQVEAPKVIIRSYGSPDSPVNTDLL